MWCGWRGSNPTLAATGTLISEALPLHHQFVPSFYRGSVLADTPCFGSQNHFIASNWAGPPTKRHPPFATHRPKSVYMRCGNPAV
jgi:hypothetical protein